MLAKRRSVRLGSSLDDVESNKISVKYICKKIIHSQEDRQSMTENALDLTEGALDECSEGSAIE